MRTEQEIRAMCARIKEINDAIWERLKTNLSEAEDLNALFNSNSSLICALEWVLGQETLSVVSGGGLRLVKGTA